MKSKYEVIDNFLDKEYFDSLVTLVTDLPWFFRQTITYPKEHERWAIKDKVFYMTHMFYQNNAPTSTHYEKLILLLEKLGVNCLLRIKANLYPNTETLHEHPMHIDTDYSHSGAILSLNTCDGYTKLKDGTKIGSVANRILLFDPSEEHCSTTTTNDFARFNINMNYIQEQKL
jgi:hypothetical protein